MSANKDICRIFDKLARIVVREPSGDALRAVQDLYCAIICNVGDDVAHALELAAGAHQDVLATIRKNFDWYKSAEGRPGRGDRGRP